MYKEYHTSLDDFKLVTYSGIKGGYIVAKTALEIFLKKIIPKNTIICEPFLSKRNLRTINNNKFYAKMHKKIVKTGIVDFLQYADGSNDLENISKYIRLNLKDTKKIYNILKKKKLVI
jgi:aminopeptidase-like protein